MSILKIFSIILQQLQNITLDLSFINTTLVSRRITKVSEMNPRMEIQVSNINFDPGSRPMDFKKILSAQKSSKKSSSSHNSGLVANYSFTTKNNIKSKMDYNETRNYWKGILGVKDSEIGWNLRKQKWAKFHSQPGQSETTYSRVRKIFNDRDGLGGGGTYQALNGSSGESINTMSRHNRSINSNMSNFRTMSSSAKTTAKRAQTSSQTRRAQASSRSRRSHLSG